MSRKKPQGKCTQPIIEALEPRILFSADAFGAALDFDPANDPLVDALDQVRIDYDRTVAEALKAEALKAAQQKLPDSSTGSTSLDGDNTALTGNENPARDQGIKELVLVDTDTPDYQTLLDDLERNSGDRAIEVILLDNSIDGIAQLNAILANYSALDAVHIISHGDAGAIDLGGSQLDQNSLATHRDAIASWAGAFSVYGDLLIYGCNLAANADSEQLVDQLAALTGADVAASDDLTGSAELGGDWQLEYRTNTNTNDSDIEFCENLFNEKEGNT